MRPARQIQLPKTPTRTRAISFLTLIRYLSPQPTSGWDFKGERYKPGVWIDEKDLWPTSDYPDTPIALEFTEALYVDNSRRGIHRQRPIIHVVWIYVEGEWREVARYTGHGLDWVNPIAAVVRKLLNDQSKIQPPVELLPIMRRIIDAINKELLALPRDQDRLELLGAIYEYFAAETAHRKSGVQLPLDWERYFEGR